MKSHSVCIITHSFVRPDGSELQIGGVQTYVGALCEVLTEAGFSIEVLQCATQSFRKQLNSDVEVIGIAGNPDELKKHYHREHCGKHPLTVFAYFDWAVWNRGEPYVAIQHGIATDGFATQHTGISRTFHEYFRRYELWGNRRATRRILDSAAKIVCVDLNFPNWVRATFPFQRWEEKLAYVPNFGTPISESELEAKLRRNRNVMQVLIARRFEAFRGVLLMADAVADIASDFTACEFQFVGSGRQEKELRSALAGTSNSRIFEIPYQDMPAALLESDISVVPTLWSEGTSLSCIEGMCAGNAVLTTNVGGLSNLVLNEFNGLIVEPTFDALRSALVRLLSDSSLREKLARYGHRVACECFSRKRWKSALRQQLLPFLDS